MDPAKEELLSQIGVKFEKKIYLEDVAGAMEKVVIKLRLLSALSESSEVRQRLMKIADDAEITLNNVLDVFHGNDVDDA